MPRKKKPPLTFAERMHKLAAAQIKGNQPLPSVAEPSPSYCDNLEDLSVRVRRILQLTEKAKKNPGRMIFFVMYDIEDNKVRRLVSEYLERKGCTRIQRSIFLAETSAETYNAIRNDLTDVQAAYDNHDSIIVLPVSTDYLRMMKIIGQQIAVDVITHSRNTLFF